MAAPPEMEARCPGRAFRSQAGLRRMHRCRALRRTAGRIRPAGYDRGPVARLHDLMLREVLCVLVNTDRGLPRP